MPEAAGPSGSMSAGFKGRHRMCLGQCPRSVAGGHRTAPAYSGYEPALVTPLVTSEGVAVGGAIFHVAATRTRDCRPVMTPAGKCCFHGDSHPSHV